MHGVLPMYMGVILTSSSLAATSSSAPHVYGGDPQISGLASLFKDVLPMYMGVILTRVKARMHHKGAPHVYGGDPGVDDQRHIAVQCSPCIWG